jgi:hypothetical protein
MQKKTMVSQMLLENNNLAWSYLKIKKMKQMYDDPYYYFKEFKLDDELKEQIKGSLKIEIITSAVQFAEIFGIYMRCFHDCNKVIHKKILNYEVKEVIDFYQKIQTKRVTYFRKMLGYPSFRQVLNEEWNTKLNESSDNVKKMLIRISKFYLKYRFLYNSYKHGLRAFPMFMGENSNSQPFTIVLRKNLNTVIIWHLNLDEAMIITDYIWNIMHDTIKVYRDRILDNKTEYNVRIY